MKKARIAIIVLLGVLLLSGLACSTTEWQLTTIVEGQGEISPSSGTFPDGEEVTLTAIPESGWKFDHWGGQASGTINPITITMNTDKTVQAYFTKYLLYSDDFSDPSSGWDTYDREGGSAFYQDGWFHLKDNTDDNRYWLSYANQQLSDFILDIDMKRVDGTSKGSASIIFKQEDRKYIFSFSWVWEDQRGYWIKEVVNDVYTTLAQPHYSIAILPGKDVVNHIHIECVDDTLKLSINERLKETINDCTCTGTDIGLGVSTWHSREFIEVAFDNIVVTAPQAVVQVYNSLT